MRAEKTKRAERVGMFEKTIDVERANGREKTRFVERVTVFRPGQRLNPTGVKKLTGSVGL